MVAPQTLQLTSNTTAMWTSMEFLQVVPLFQTPAHRAGSAGGLAGDLGLGLW